MKLKQEDRNLLREFFCSQTDWMKCNSLLNSENLDEFKNRFLNFLKSKSCEENLVCKHFQFTLENELQRCKQQNNTNVQTKVKLNYNPIVKPLTDNPLILLWVDESMIAYEVSESHIKKLDMAIQRKVKRNEAERKASYQEAKKFTVRD